MRLLGRIAASVLASAERAVGRPLGPRQAAALAELAATPDSDAAGVPAAGPSERHGHGAIAGLVRRGLVDVDVSIHPPFTDIRSVQTVIDTDKLGFALGAQNCHWEEKGAFTGEVAPTFLAKLGVDYVIAGHSERRELFGETDEMVAKKVAAIQQQGMTPILCVGEGLPVREEGEHLGHCTSQLTGALAKVTAEQAADLVVAYEPIWAIGTGRVASPADAQEVCAALRARVAEVWGPEAAAAVRLLYGGSVKAANVAGIMEKPDVDGCLVGGASLQADEFGGICRFYDMPVI